MYRDKQCPHCGFYFTARGLAGHLKFKHGEHEDSKLGNILVGLKFADIMNRQGIRLTEEQRELLLDMFLMKQLREGKL